MTYPKRKPRGVTYKLIRIPTKVLRQVKLLARRDRRSVNAQIVHALETLAKEPE